MTREVLDLLVELQALDKVPRMGYSQRGVPEPESVSEHLFHVAFLVWALAPRVPDLDAGHAVALALLHDLAEVRLGDLPKPAGRYLPTGVKDGAELAAFRDLLAPLGSARAEQLAEYQAAATREARFVRVCDKAQLLIKASVYDRWGHAGAGEFLDRLDDFDDGGFAPIRELVDRLSERRARG